MRDKKEMWCKHFLNTEARGEKKEKNRVKSTYNGVVFVCLA